jgi:hypothetical protein
MRRAARSLSSLLLAVAACWASAAMAQAASPYSLRLGPEARSGSLGGGLSLEAGDRWFARMGMANTLAGSADNDRFSLGGGYRFNDSESLSLQLVRSRLPQRLGLAVRYDWASYYLRLSYDRRWSDTSPDRLRFSAGFRF